MKSPYELIEKEFELLVKTAKEKYNSPIERYILRKSLAVVDNILEHHNRIFAFRTDLRFAEDHVPDDPDSPVCYQRVDPQAITRCIESLKSQLREDHKRSGRPGKAVSPAYVWARERDTSKYPHYHLMLLFNRNVYGYLGNYTNRNADNMAVRIQKAWCSAVDLDYPYQGTLAHFPKNQSFKFDRSDALARSPVYEDFLLRMAYLAKEKTKNVHQGYHNFGTSQLKQVTVTAM